jgi:hypothetical protein
MNRPAKQQLDKRDQFFYQLLVRTPQPRAHRHNPLMPKLIEQYLGIKSVPQRKRHASTLQISTG